MGLINTVRDKLRSFLRIEPPQQSTITIQQNLDYYANVAKNRILSTTKKNTRSESIMATVI